MKKVENCGHVGVEQLRETIDLFAIRLRNLVVTKEIAQALIYEHNVCCGDNNDYDPEKGWSLLKELYKIHQEKLCESGPYVDKFLEKIDEESAVNILKTVKEKLKNGLVKELE